MINGLLLWELVNDYSIDVTNQDRPNTMETVTNKLFRALINGKWEYSEITETRCEKIRSGLL